MNHKTEIQCAHQVAGTECTGVYFKHMSCLLKHLVLKFSVSMETRWSTAAQAADYSTV